LVEKRTSQIFNLCLVGLKPDSLSFSVYIFKLLIVIYNDSKLFLYYNLIKSSIKKLKFMKKNSFTYDELISCGNGELFGPGNAKLPLPPMLMFDRITEINEDNGIFGKGSLKAELDIKDDLWFFDCHFKEDPVMPGCLGLDAMWQLVGFYLGWLGNPGKGRALGVSTVKFTGEVLKNVKNVRYEIDIKKIMAPGGTTVGLANGLVFADDKKIYSADSLKVGLFK
jgi:3-hydroxyacyl-[acyl-carrier protein] dehydratase/trans-2-decenoyl-[acyl-carrier protein] isomerase